MKKLFSLMAVIFLFALPAQSQDVTYIDSLQASGVTNANTHTQGFSAFVLLRTDYNDYGTRRITLYGLSTTDSIKFQGAILNKTRDVPDTQWVDLPIVEKFMTLGLAINGGASTKDTMYYWYSNVGRVAANAHYTASQSIELPYGYDLYRVCAAKNDSGKVYVRQHLWEGVFGALPYDGPAFVLYRFSPELAACYFEHQRA